MIRIYHPDGRVLVLDVVSGLQVSRSAVVAQHPMEEGAPAVDHVEPQNDTITLTAKITENPIDPGSMIHVLEDLTGPDRVQAAADFLRDCVGEFVDVIEPDRGLVFEGCLLTTHPYEYSIVHSSPFTLQFVIPRLVDTEFASIPSLPSVPAALQKEAEVGPPATEELTDSDVSVLQDSVRSGAPRR